VEKKCRKRALRTAIASLLGARGGGLG